MNWLSYLLVFSISFTIPFYATVKVGESVFGISEYEIDSEKEDLFPYSFVVNSAGTTYRVRNAPGLEPVAGKDFLMISWIKLRKPLEVGDRAIFVGKYDPKTKTRPGYSIGLTRDADGTRPIVYWQDESGIGRWYTFSSVDITPRSWMMLALSFRKGRYLGVHAAENGTLQKVQLLGGYELDGELNPTNDADLIIGSFGDSKFRGRIGPVGTVILKSLPSDLAGFVGELAKRPREIPSSVSLDDIGLWTNGSADLSKNQHTIITKIQ